MDDTSGTGLRVTSTGTDDAGRRIHALSVSDVPDDSVTVAVSLLIEEVCGAEVLERVPLSESVNPDGLDEMFDPPDGTSSDLTVTFRHAGCDIRIIDGERIELVEAE